MNSPLERYETEGLLKYKESLERNVAAIEEALGKEKANLTAVDLELKVRERQEA
jgi:hypothetical protein